MRLFSRKGQPLRREVDFVAKKIIIDTSVHDLHGETVSLDAVEYRPMGTKTRWRAFATTSTHEAMEFWIFGEHGRMIKASGHGKLPRKAVGKHWVHGIDCVLEWEQQSTHHARGYRMIGVLQDDGTLVGDPRAVATG